ncbi:MAG: PEP-CTERM sorting domain-containing protein [Bryobacteraceae bacterium]
MTLVKPFAATVLSTLFASAFAATLVVPSTTVLGTNGSGVNFAVVGNFLAVDTISAATTGTVDLASGRFTSNAAGIITAPPLTNTGNVPGQVSPNLSMGNFGALLIGNSTLGFFQLFPSNAANGLGNSAAPTTLNSTATLGSIFGSGFAGLSNGTNLTLKVSDCTGCFDDNSGSFRVGPASGPAVPEPVSWSLVLPVMVVLALASKRMRAGHAR